MKTGNAAGGNAGTTATTTTPSSDNNANAGNNGGNKGTECKGLSQFDPTTGSCTSGSPSTTPIQTGNTGSNTGTTTQMQTGNNGGSTGTECKGLSSFDPTTGTCAPENPSTTPMQAGNTGGSTGATTNSAGGTAQTGTTTGTGGSATTTQETTPLSGGGCPSGYHPLEGTCKSDDIPYTSAAGANVVCVTGRHLADNPEKHVYECVPDNTTPSTTTTGGTTGTAPSAGEICNGPFDSIRISVTRTIRWHRHVQDNFTEYGMLEDFVRTQQRGYQNQ
jgi:hypothetical protein